MDEPAELQVPRQRRPRPDAVAFDLDRALSSVVSLSAEAPADAFTATALGTERSGSGVLIRDDGLVLTIGYLVTEVEQATLRTGASQSVSAHVLGYDQATGLGLLQALEPLDIPAMPMGVSAPIGVGDSVILAAGGGRSRAVDARLLARQEFAGYWEYLLDEALFTGPAHPHWSGAAMIDAAGELVGIASLQLEQRENDGRVVPFNMSVPIELLAPILDDLERGRPTAPARPWLGVLAQEIGGMIVIVGVSPGGPASRVKVAQGDAVLALAGESVSDLADLYRRLWAMGDPGVAVPLTLRRGSRTLDVTVESADRRQMLRKPRYH